jgi:hypothetical protein
MPVTIKIHRTSSSGATPSTLQPGELAINLADKKLFYGNASQVPVPLAQAVFVQSSGSTPVAPMTGAFWFQTNTNKLRVYNGSTWVDAMPLDTEIQSVRDYVDQQIASLELAIQGLWPVGSILFTEKTGNPATWMTFGTWSRVSEGRFIAGEGTGTDLNGKQETATIGNIPGYYDYQLTAANIPQHSHQYVMKNKNNTGNPGADNNHQVGDTGNASNFNSFTSGTYGSSNPAPVETSPPAYGLYVWKRTA